MASESQFQQFLDVPASLVSDREKSLICTLKIDSIQYIENHLCIVGWSTKPIKIFTKERAKWKELLLTKKSRPDVEKSIKTKPGNDLGFIATIKTEDRKDKIQLRIESINNKLQSATLDEMGLLADENWKHAIITQLEEANLIKKPINYKENQKTPGHHPEGHGHLEIARKSRGFEDMVVIGWLSAKEDNLFFIETDDGNTIPITDTFRFFRPDIENTGLPASHGKIRERAGFIIYIKLASKIKKLQLCGIHGNKTYLIHEITPEIVNESAENSIEWAKNIVHTAPEEFTNRMKYFEIPYQNTRLDTIKNLLKNQTRYKTINSNKKISTIIIATSHWRAKTLITSLQANNIEDNQFTVIFENSVEEEEFKTLKPTLRAAFGLEITTLCATSLYEVAYLNAIIDQIESELILIINDQIMANQPRFIHLANEKLKASNAFALIPRQLDIYGDEYSAYIEVNQESTFPKIKHQRKFIDKTPDAMNKAFNLDCVLFNRKKLSDAGGIENFPDIRSPYPRRMSLTSSKNRGATIFPSDVYVTSLRENKIITSSPPTSLDIKNFVYLNLI